MGHRGPHPEDPLLFRDGALPALRRAYEEVSWLLGRGYRLEFALRVAGEHHQLHARQRLALQRTVCDPERCAARRGKVVPIAEAGRGPWSVDGFNLIITLEVALSGGVLLRGGDRALRDLAGLRGSYHLVEETDAAIELLGAAIRALGPPAIRIWLDAPISNSGRLRARIAEQAASWPIPVEIDLVPDADPCLFGRERVISSDSVVLDECASFINLAPWILDNFLYGARDDVRDFAEEFAGRVKTRVADRPGIWIVDLDPDSRPGTPPDPRRGD